MDENQKKIKIIFYDYYIRTIDLLSQLQYLHQTLGIAIILS